MYHVILAGGSGTRFWPQSREDRPKQFLKIIGDRTMIRMTVDRIRRFSSPEKILVVASERLTRLIQDEIPEIPQGNYLIEPNGRNTAPAIGLAAIHVAHRDPDAVMGVYPSDHLITGETEFIDTIKIAEKFVEDSTALLTLGVRPSYPATGYGYIQFQSGELANLPESVYQVKTFAEKPPLEIAEQFLRSGEFLWNSGMFLWSANTILGAMKKHMPDLYTSLKAVSDFIDTDRYDTVLDREWELVHSQSIDYGILEKADNVYTIKAKFKWSDMGSWKSVYDILAKNEQGNVIQGEVVTRDAERSLIISPDRLTVLVGVHNMAVINLTDVTLILPLHMAERVKELVEFLWEEGKQDYL